MVENKTALRLAVVIHEQLGCSETSKDACDLPDAAWQQCQTLARHMHRAQQRGWTLATARCQRDLRARLNILHGELTGIAQQLDSNHRHSKSIATIQDVYRDLLALHDEFDSVSWDRRQQTLSVTTEPIELDGVYLGEFELRLDWGDLADGHPNNYRVIALDAHPAASNDSVTHPHVQDEAVCEGDGRVPIRNALEQGRLFDFFVIVRNLLQTYNAGSPYVELADWHGVTCSDCGSSTCEDDCWSCTRCESTMCDGCHYGCSDCGDACCAECIERCAAVMIITAEAALSRATNAVICAATVVSMNKKGVATAMKNKPKNRQANRLMLGANLPMPPAALTFSPTAWAKLLFLRDYGETEVGGFGIAASDDLLFVEDVQLVKQTCSWAHVAFDDESVADFFDAQVDHGRKPEQFGRLWVHTHPGACPQPSLTDEATYERVFGRSDWAVMFIVAREGQTYARLRFNVGPGGAIEIPVEIDYSRPFSGCEGEAWQQEYLANVRADQGVDGDAMIDTEPSKLNDPCFGRDESDWVGLWPDDELVPDEPMERHVYE